MCFQQCFWIELSGSGYNSVCCLAYICSVVWGGTGSFFVGVFLPMLLMLHSGAERSLFKWLSTSDGAASIN